MTNPARKRGRGAVSNPTGRFEATTRHTEPVDPWVTDDPDIADTSNTTTVSIDTSRSVIARNTSPDLGFDRSINPYRGCEHGCIYCFARPTHAFLGFSPGLDFEQQILIKPDAAKRLREELARPGYRPAPIALGTNTDPYQPRERDLRITRSILEVLAACGHPLTITTKSAAVVRDLDILTDLAERNLVSVAISVTTLDPKTARTMEPRASAPHRRLEALRQLGEAGIPTAVMAAPIIPGLTDHELEPIIAAAADAGVSGAGFILLRLPGEVAELFQQWLVANVPDRATRVMNRIRGLRGGQLYDNAFGRRMTGTGPEAELLYQRFQLACRKHRLNAGRERRLSLDHFRKPVAAGQLTLL